MFENVGEFFYACLGRRGFTMILSYAAAIFRSALQFQVDVKSLRDVKSLQLLRNARVTPAPRICKAEII